jgi:thymidylate synthase
MEIQKKMNKLDLDYQNLLKDILENGTKKETRNGGTISIFGYTIRHKMSDGFPLLTTKKMAWKTMVTELLWFLRGDTNIKYLVDNGCHIWDGDAYKAYVKKHKHAIRTEDDRSEIAIQMLEEQLIYPKEEFINKIKTDDEFAKTWGELGSIYGKQWRSWKKPIGIGYSGGITLDGTITTSDPKIAYDTIDQIANLISELRTNPDSRRLMVNAWNVGELDQMVLPPCHYGFQVYTRELSDEERLSWMKKNKSNVILPMRDPNVTDFSIDEWFRPYGVPKRAISLMFNMRSCDVPLGLPFNISSYGLLLEIIAKMVNMVPDELIGNLGDTHIYLNQIDGIKQQIEREPYPLPKLVISNQIKGNEGIDGFLSSCLVSDFQIENYQSHPTIKIPLSN